ncbi:MAG: hypothetical protein ACJ76J_30560 [Thermoanaerobaculia bacterium]
MGHLAKEEEEAEKARLDERWDRLAAGTLTAEEEAELRALAETSPEAREAWEAFRPLGPEFQARVVEKIAAELSKPKKKESWWDWLLSFLPAVRFAGWATSAAAAAAVLVVLARPAPLPDYQIAVTGGSSAMRGEQQETVRAFALGDRIEVHLRPETASRGKLEAQLFLLREGELRRLDTKNTIEDGSVRMNALLERSFPVGTWTLWAVVGRPGDLPDPAQLKSLAAREEIRRRNWVAIPWNIRIRSPDP